ncbi:STAS domain-containing protein [bacterium]|nr:STAS domain-containing protein [bacterium]
MIELSAPHTPPSPATPPSTAADNAFLPKIVTVLREGYHLADLRADAVAGLTVAIVALPLSMAIAIASGVGPERGLFTSIIGGFLVSLLGGSRYQIGGPAGAFIVLVAACVTAIGVPGLLLATALSGLFLTAAGLLRLGSYVKFIPYPVTLGFTAGIAVIIFSSQVKDLFGLHLTGAEPAALLPKIAALWGARASFGLPAASVALATNAVIVGLKRAAPRLPNLLIAVTLASLAVYLFKLPVETIFDRFGALPRTPPAPALPALDMASLVAALPYAASFTLLGAIESLLSAVVADGMSGARHRSNAELVAQGLANVGSALFGGICVTGTIARTATNVRAGSRGPVSGMLHALFVLAFMLVAAPLAGHIPLAALAGVLAVVSWNMAEKAEIWVVMRSSRADAVVILVTFGLVVFRDLTEGIVTGFALSGLVFLHRMSQSARIDTGPEPVPRHDRVLVRLSGPYFFGAAAETGHVLDQIAEHPRHFVLDLSALDYLDSSGARKLELLAHRIQRKGGQMVLLAVRPVQRRILEKAGLEPPLARYVAHLDDLDAG